MVSLMDALYSTDETERREAAEELGGSGDRAVVAALAERLRVEDSRSVKEAMLRALAHLSSAGPLDAIVELLKDDDPFVRAEAAEILQNRAEDAVELLLELLHGDDKDLRKFSIDILTASPHTTPDAVYLAALRDMDVNVVLSTIENIGVSRRRSMEAQVTLLAVTHAHPMVVCSCLETLASIGTADTLASLRERFPSTDTVPPLYLQPFLKVLGSTGGEESLGEICASLEGQPVATITVAVDAMLKIALRSRATANEEVERTLCALLPLQTDAALQRRMVRMLGCFAKSPGVTEAVLPYFDGDDRLLAFAAMEALVAVPSPAIDAALATALEIEGDPDLREELQDLIGRRSYGTHI